MLRRPGSAGRFVEQRLQGRVLERLRGLGVVEHLLERLLHTQRLRISCTDASSVLAKMSASVWDATRKFLKSSQDMAS